MKQLDRKNVAAIVLAVLLLLFLLIFTGFEAAETHHDCDGGQCPICWFLNQAKETSKVLALAGLSLAFCLFLFNTVRKLGVLPAETVRRVTPVTLKVKLSN